MKYLKVYFTVILISVCFHWQAGSTTSTTAYNILIVPETLPFTEDLETMSLCSSAEDCSITSCALTNGWTNLTNGVDDDIEWRIDSGGTSSPGTGPSIDANPGTATGRYAYLEASGSCYNQSAEMVSPEISLIGTSLPILTFSYHMEGINVGSLHLDVYSDAVWTTDVLPIISGNQGSAWITAIVDLSAYKEKAIQIKIRGVTGGGWSSDIAIDNIQIADEGSCMVTNTLDSGPGSLRDCVENASSGQVIAFDNVVFNSEISLTSGQLLICANVNIEGAMTNNISISAGSMNRVFEIMSGMDALIEGIEIKAGIATEGNAIMNNGNLIMQDVIIHKNTGAPSGSSVIYNSGTIQIEGDCRILNN